MHPGVQCPKRSAVSWVTASPPAEALHGMHVLHYPASYSCNCCRMLQDNSHSYQRTNTHSRPLVLGQPYIEPDAADQDI